MELKPDQRFHKTWVYWKKNNNGMLTPVKKLVISNRVYFRSNWTAGYWFWAHLIWVLCETDILCEHFSFLAYQRSVQLLYETLDTLIEALTGFSVSLNFVDRQTGTSKDQALKKHHFSRIGPVRCHRWSGT